MTALFLGRICYRLIVIYQQSRAEAGQDQNPLAYLQRSPLTMVVFGLLIGYYVFFNLGVLRRSRELLVPPAATAEPRVLHLGNHLFGGFRLDQHRGAAIVILAADFGDREAARGPVEQAHAQSFLQQQDAAAELRFLDAERPAGGREAAMIDHPNEIEEVVKVLHIVR